MKRSLQAIPLVLLFFGLGNVFAWGQTEADDFYRHLVDYRDGEVSFEFDRTPIVFALYAIQAKTGFEIVMPSSSDARLVNFRLRRQPFEPAIRSLISTIGFENFALLYDASGRPNRAVVLHAQPVAARSLEETPKIELSKQPLSAEERDKLQKDLARWRELKQEERIKIEARLKTLSAGEERDKLISEYGRQMLELER